MQQQQQQQQQLGDEESGQYAFQLAELTVAGAYSAVAEYVERRPELVGAGGGGQGAKREATLRSASVLFRVLPCPPVALRWVAWFGSVGKWRWWRGPAGALCTALHRALLSALKPEAWRLAHHTAAAWRRLRCRSRWR